MEPVPRVETQAGVCGDQIVLRWGRRGFDLTVTLRPVGLVIETTIDGNFAGPSGAVSWELLDALRDRAGR